MKDDEGRYILIDNEMLNKRLTLANLHAPSSGDHPEFFDKVINEVVSMDNELIVIGVDWNVALPPPPRKKKKKKKKKKIKHINRVLDLHLKLVSHRVTVSIQETASQLTDELPVYNSIQ